jgi:hypothetical protein
VKVELTMPTVAKSEQQMTIGWRGTYAEGTALRAPTAGLGGGVKLYAYASISGISRLTSATGVGVLDTIGADQTIPLPTEVALKTTARNAGTAMVRPAAMNIGDRPTKPLIQCRVLNPDDLETYTLTVTADVTPSNTNDTSTETPAKRDDKFAMTPAGAAETGGGGDAGPDGRVFVLTGFLIILLSAAGGLLLRRSAVTRG